MTASWRDTPMTEPISTSTGRQRRPSSTAAFGAGETSLPADDAGRDASHHESATAAIQNGAVPTNCRGIG